MSTKQAWTDAERVSYCPSRHCSDLYQHSLQVELLLRIIASKGWGVEWKNVHVPEGRTVKSWWVLTYMNCPTRKLSFCFSMHVWEKFRKEYKGPSGEPAAPSTPKSPGKGLNRRKNENNNTDDGLNGGADTPSTPKSPAKTSRKRKTEDVLSSNNGEVNEDRPSQSPKKKQKQQQEKEGKSPELGDVYIKDEA